MKLSAYIVRCDTGFAPNPFGRYCTLACCKPTIRRCAEEDDIIIGIAPADSERARCLVYAMKVKEILPYDDYWKDTRFAHRKPLLTTPIRRRGDNIWHRDREGRWRVAVSEYHTMRHRKRDTRGENALVASEFYYFGRATIPIPPRFAHLLATTQGHKNTHDVEEINRFWAWLTSVTPRVGRFGDPADFTADACLAQRREIDDDDVEESC
jgi:hypothetical protein